MAEQTSPETQTQVETTPAAEETTLLGTQTQETKTEAKEGEQKPEGERPKAVVPEKYELKAPEGMTIDQAMLDQYVPVFKELGITNEGAQKLADIYSKSLKAQSDNQSKQSINQYKEIVEGWKTETMKELGADTAKTLAAASKAIDKLGGEKLREVLNETGVGNHPEMVRFFANVGKKLSEDNFAEPTNTKTGRFTDIYDHPDSKANLK